MEMVILVILDITLSTTTETLHSLGHFPRTSVLLWTISFKGYTSAFSVGVSIVAADNLATEYALKIAYSVPCTIIF